MYEENYLQHYGVLGMKWGVRRYRNEDGSLTSAGKKRQKSERSDSKWTNSKAVKKYDELDTKKRAYKQTKKAYNKARNNALRSSVAAYSPFEKHREASKTRRNIANEKANDMNTAKQAYKNIKKEIRENATPEQKANRGAKQAARGLSTIGKTYIVDQTIFGGAGTRATKQAVQAVGILSISAIAKARGASDIQWYDNNGRRIV